MHDTSKSSLKSPRRVPAGVGVATRDQFLPFQCKAWSSWIPCRSGGPDRPAVRRCGAADTEQLAGISARGSARARGGHAGPPVTIPAQGFIEKSPIPLEVPDRPAAGGRRAVDVLQASGTSGLRRHRGLGQEVAATPRRGRDARGCGAGSGRRPGRECQRSAAQYPGHAPRPSSCIHCHTSVTPAAPARTRARRRQANRRRPNARVHQASGLAPRRKTPYSGAGLPIFRGAAADLPRRRAIWGTTAWNLGCRSRFARRRASLRSEADRLFGNLRFQDPLEEKWRCATRCANPLLSTVRTGEIVQAVFGAQTASRAAGRGDLRPSCSSISIATGLS